MALYTNIKGPINYTIVGSPTIENGIVSGFSSSDYLILPEVNSKDITEILVKIKTPSSSYLGQNTYMSILYGDFQLFIYSGANSFQYTGFNFNGLSDLYINHNLNPDTDYWLKYKTDGVNCTAFWSEDGINYTAGQTKLKSLMNPHTVTIKIGTRGNDRIFKGSVYLNETHINTNDTAWFGTSFSKVKLHSPTAISYTKVGNPTITSDGVASGFTDKTDYLTLGAFNPGTSKWKFTTKVKIYDYATQISLIDRNSSTRCFQIVVRTTGKFRVNISTNGTSKANEVDGTHVVSVNTIYYLSFEYDGSKYYLKYSLDNINWVTDITINNSTKIYPVSSMCMGHSWYNSGTEKWNGEIYLRYTRFEIDGVTNDKYKLHALEGDYAIVDGRLVWANPNIYLQSSGTQYIDIEYYLQSNNLKVITTFTYNFSLTSSEKDLCGNQDNSTNRFVIGMYQYYIFAYSRNQSGTDTNVRTTTYSGEQKIQLEVNYDYTNSVKTINSNGTITTQTFSKSIAPSTNSILLFSDGKSSSTSAFPSLKSNMYKFYDNGTLVRYLVPVPTGLQIGDFTVPSNGMFDIIEQKFYPNQGTGTFTYGKDE